MNVLKKVLFNPKYAVLGTIVALILVVFAVWLPNLSLITTSLTSSGFTLGQKVSLLTALLGSIETNFTTLSRSLLITSAILMGIQVSLVTYYVRQTAKLQQDMGVSFIAMCLSLLGVGCASCGSVLLATLFGFGAMTSIVRPLPFKGQEFSIIGLAILVFATWHTVRKINQPIVCEVRRNHGKKI
jgi:hypothetical protein